MTGTTGGISPVIPAGAFRAALHGVMCGTPPDGSQNVEQDDVDTGADADAEDGGPAGGQVELTATLAPMRRA
jgi:hypothetical protein